MIEEINRYGGNVWLKSICTIVKLATDRVYRGQMELEIIVRQLRQQKNWLRR